VKNYIEDKFNVMLYQTTDKHWVARKEDMWYPKTICVTKTLFGMFINLFMSSED
jgi:hypothetical protein